MLSNKYLFCGVCLELRSNEPIVQEAEFSQFSAYAEEAELSFDIIRTDSLPPQTGEAIRLSERRIRYVDGDCIKTYTAYFDSPSSRLKDYACLTNDGKLYISFPDNLREVTVFDALNLPSLLLERSIGILHCSFIEHKGGAILFCADKQVGKSTQASLWEKHRGVNVINGDRAAVFEEDGVFFAEGIPFCGTSKICHRKKLPITAIVCLSQGISNDLRRLPTLDAFLSLFGKFAFDSTQDETEKTATLTERIAAGVPVYSYSCLKDESAVDCLENEIKKLIK